MQELLNKLDRTYGYPVIKEITRQDHATRYLVASIVSDLQWMKITSMYGSGTQACIIASSTFEKAWILSDINLSNEAAEKWYQHDENKRTYKNSFKPVIESVIGELAEDENKDDIIDEFWNKMYSFLCREKHANTKSLGYISNSEGNYEAPYFFQIDQSGIDKIFTAVESVLRSLVVSVSAWLHRKPDEVSVDLKLNEFLNSFRSALQYRVEKHGRPLSGVYSVDLYRP